MNTTVTHTSPLARFGRRIVAIVTECNDAQTRLSNAQHTPDRF